MLKPGDEFETDETPTWNWTACDEAAHAAVLALARSRPASDWDRQARAMGALGLHHRARRYREFIELAQEV
jgi:hypothetical protein